MLTLYAIERLLFRLSQTEAAEDYVLKGAMLFATWPEHVARPTGDLDLLGRGDPSPDAIRAIFTDVCDVTLDLPTPRVLMYPPESVVAEKLEAMISLGETNGRLKDFYDLWLITRTFAPELATLVEAVGGTLRRRQTAPPIGTPVGLTDEYAKLVEARGLWSGFLRRSPPPLSPPPFVEVQAALRRFFSPVLASLAAPEAARGRWDRGAGAWRGA